MRTHGRIVVATFVLAAAVIAAVMYITRPAPQPPPLRAGLSVAEALGGTDTLGFDRVTAARDFDFPRDHGPHDGYRTEWWYFTGNVDSDDGHRFGYQLTLFRNALSASEPDIASAWATNHVWMAHLAVTDVSRGEFHGFERFVRGAAGLAGAHAEPLRVWVEDWSIAGRGDPGETGVFPVRLRAIQDGIGIDLEVTPHKPLVLQGDRGYSRKGADPGNASHYYSFTRLATTGTVRIGDARFDVTGTSWLDREWSTSALDDGQAGWDWFALQFDDDTELMYYQLRRHDGSADVHSRGTFVDRAGATAPLLRDAVSLAVLATWNSPRGGSYPARWRLRVDGIALDVEIVPVLADQEHDTFVRYWEGAVDVTGTRRGVPVRGRGYVELTGYADATAVRGARRAP